MVLWLWKCNFKSLLPSSDGLLLPVSPHGLPSSEACVQISSSYKDTGQIELELALWASFSVRPLITFLIAITQIEAHSEVLGVRTSTCKLCRDTIQCVIPFLISGVNFFFSSSRRPGSALRANFLD